MRVCKADRSRITEVDLMKKIVAALTAVMLVCGAAVLPAAESGIGISSITASADTVTSELSLSSNMTVSGDLLASANVKLNGHTLTVKGNMRMTAGTLTLGGGTLNVQGDLLFQNENGTASKAITAMSNANDRINVDGNFVWDVSSSVASSPTFSAGTITVKGNFTDTSDGSRSAVRARNTNRLVLSGSGTHTVELSEWSYLNELQVESGNIVGKNFLHFKSLVNDLRITPDNLTLRGIYCMGHALTVNGDVSQNGMCDLAGGSMTVNGSLKVLSGKTTLNGGTINVRDNYYIRSEYTQSGEIKYQDASACLIMSNASDTVKVGKDFEIRSQSEFANTLTNGVIYVGGNFTDSATTSAGSFKASSSHKLVLNGSGEQTVTGNVYTAVNELEAVNSANRKITYKKYFNVAKLTGDSVFYTDNLLMKKFAPGGKKVTFKGDLKQACNVDLAGSAVTVTGSFTQINGSMKLNGGSLTVGGSYGLQSAEGGTAPSTLNMSNANDKLTVGGDFIFKSTGSNTLTNGVLTVSGNITDGSSSGFKASMQHKTVLNGDNHQTVDMPSGTFNILELTRSMSNYTFTKNNCWVKLISTAGNTTDLADCTVSLSASSYTYDGAAKKPSVTVKYGSKTLTQGTDYTVTYAKNVNAGTATVTVKGIGSYSGTVNKSFKINAKSVGSCGISLAYTSRYFSGTRAKPAVTIKNGSAVLVKDKDYTAYYYDNLSVGTARVVITGKGNYSGTVTKTYQIVQRSIANCDIVLDPTSAVFCGERIRPSVKVYCNGTEMYSGNYKISYTNNLSAGTASVTLTGMRNLKGTAVRSFKITPLSVKSCNVIFTANSSDRYKPDVTLKYQNRDIYSGNYTVSYVKTGEGKLTVTITGKNNLNGSITKTLSV